MPATEQQPAPKKDAPKVGQQRRELARMRYAVRPYVKPRVSKCGCTRIASDVILTRTDGRAGAMGVLKCGSVWECPVCSAQMKVKRADEIVKLVKAWRAKYGTMTTWLLSLTIRHTFEDKLSHTGPGVLACIRKLFQGRAWVEFRKEYGLEYIRGWETTHSFENGWHPHLHLLVVADRPIGRLDAEHMRNFILARWQEIVGKTLGGKHIPSDEIGAKFHPCGAGQYIAKLGLEVANAPTKKGKKGSRTPMQIASDLARFERTEDGHLFAAFADAMRGRRMLHWSPGARDFLDQLPPDEPPPKEFAAALEGCDFDELRRLQVRAGDDPSTMEVRRDIGSNTTGIEREHTTAPRRGTIPRRWTSATVMAFELAERSATELREWIETLLGAEAAERTRHATTYYGKHWGEAIAYPGGVFAWMKDQETPGTPPVHDHDPAEFQD